MPSNNESQNILDDKSRQRQEEFRERMSRRKVLLLGYQDIRELLQLPEDVFVVGLTYDWQRESVVINIVSDAFERVPDYVEAPIAYKEIEYVECDQGNFHVKYNINETGIEEI